MENAGKRGKDLTARDVGLTKHELGDLEIVSEISSYSRARLMDGPTRNLSWVELACHDGTPYPPEWRGDRAMALGQAFEDVRAECGGRPLRVGSAYRTLAWNRQSGSKDTSQHIEGRALDLYPNMAFDEFAAAVLRVARARLLIRGVGLYRSGFFVHIDTRPLLRLALWNGRRPRAEV